MKIIMSTVTTVHSPQFHRQFQAQPHSRFSGAEHDNNCRRPCSKVISILSLVACNGRVLEAEEKDTKAKNLDALFATGRFSLTRKLREEPSRTHLM